MTTPLTNSRSLRSTRVPRAAQVRSVAGIASRRRRLLAAGLAWLAGLCGCANYGREPEINPGAWTTQDVRHEWAASSDTPGLVRAPDAAEERFEPPPHAAGKPMDLNGLIDFALAANPDTRRLWEAAQAAAAAYGRSRALFYPAIDLQSEDGYQRLADLVPRHWGTLKTWQSRSLLSLNYDLIDFGRRTDTALAAQQQLVAANLLFNRQVQTVVFAVEKSAYEMQAAQSGVTAAQSVVRLAVTDRIAVERRQLHGLATRPDVLLARQREAQAQYDLESARLAVELSRADLADAIGIRADQVPEVAFLANQPLPATLAPDVEKLIAAAQSRRPDIAARVSALRASQADVALARASFYPTLGITGFYGLHAFNYVLSNPPTPNFTATAPEYGTALVLKWDVFSGFSRLNAIREATARSAMARAELRTSELTAVSDVWRAYFSFRTALKKYRYAQTLLDASRSAYDSNLKSYNHGLNTIVNLLAAQRDLAGADFTLIQSKAEVLISAAALAYATGAVPAQAQP